MSEARQGALRVDLDRRLKLELHDSGVTSDAGLPAYRQPDDALEPTEALGPTTTAAAALADCWSGLDRPERDIRWQLWVTIISPE